jgi:transposase
MEAKSNLIGIDMSADDFAACGIKSPDSIIFNPQKFNNSFEGMESFSRVLEEYKIAPSETIICMEATGVYTEKLCYYLASKGFTLCIEAPHKIKNKIKDSPRKNDLIDSKDIAEYAYRYTDKLAEWKPQGEILEQVKVLLTTREHLTEQVVANQNALHSLKFKYYQTPLANQIYEKSIVDIKEHIKQIDKEIKKLTDKDDSFKHLITLVKSVPGVGLLLAANLLVLTHGFTEHLSYKSTAAYAGICPYEQQSGTSLNRWPKSQRTGPSKLRKLLYLAALSVRTHNQYFKKYFLRKVAEGKNKHLVLNNIENKLLKIIFAVISTRTPYIPGYCSVNPVFLKSA